SVSCVGTKSVVHLQVAHLLPAAVTNRAPSGKNFSEVIKRIGLESKSPSLGWGYPHDRSRTGHLVVKAGGTSRAAIYTLLSMNYTPIYISTGQLRTCGR